MREWQWKNTGWIDSDLAKVHRIRSICIFLKDHQKILDYLFLPSFPRLREEEYIFGNALREFDSEERLLIRAICHLREIQLETASGIMNDYLENPEQK
jgi:hypothetical protein